MNDITEIYCLTILETRSSVSVNTSPISVSIEPQGSIPSEGTKEGSILPFSHRFWNFCALRLHNLVFVWCSLLVQNYFFNKETSHIFSLSAYNYSSYSLISLCVSVESIVISPLSFFKLWKYDNAFTGDLEMQNKITYNSTIYCNYFCK